MEINRTTDDRERLQRICERLGLDPRQTTDIKIELPATGRAFVTWTGVRRVSFDEIADLLA